MNHFFLANNSQKVKSKELKEFPFILHFGFEQYNSIKEHSLNLHYNEGIEICFIVKGRYEWIVEDKKYLLYPGNGFITSPWEKHGSPKEVIDIGEICWISINPEVIFKNGEFNLGRWSRFTQDENNYIARFLSENKNHLLQKAGVIKSIFEKLYLDLTIKPFGYKQNIYNLIEELFLSVARIISIDDTIMQEKRKIVEDVEQMLLTDLAKKWAVNEVAETFNMGTTTFTELMKLESGYTPANFLIYLRLEKAKELLQNTQDSLIKIALNCGFYSSQHFSSTFSKWQGCSPSKFRKMNHL